MEIHQAEEKELEQVYDLTAGVIREVYPFYYPEPVVKFFLKLHSREEIRKDIREGNVYLLTDQGECVGTGTWQKRRLSRVFVRADRQKKGYGKAIMDFLEEKTAKVGRSVLVEASLPGAGFYEKRGYQTFCHHTTPVGDSYMLVYEIMRKNFSEKEKKDL